jgi:Fe-S-cluster containining protein
MKLETSISRIEALTRAGEDDHREYRRMLDRSGLSGEDIDAIVRRHNRVVSGEIECRDCGNCCRAFRPTLRAGDVQRLARRLKIEEQDFIAGYLREYGNRREYSFRATPCPFLADNQCRVYADRPEECRSYPNLHHPGFVSRLDRAFWSCSVCPIVYNVYQRVRQEIMNCTPAIR